MVGTPNVFAAPDTVGIFLSQDQGATWTAQAATGTSSTTYGGYAFHMAVHPDSPGDGMADTVYFGTLAQVRSTDAGASFGPSRPPCTLIPTPGDSPSSPGSATRVYCGNDGGIFMSSDGFNFGPLNSGGLPNRSVLQPRCQTRRNRERHTWRAPGQRRSYHSGRAPALPGMRAWAVMVSTSRTTGSSQHRPTPGATEISLPQPRTEFLCRDHATVHTS